MDPNKVRVLGPTRPERAAQRRRLASHRVVLDVVVANARRRAVYRRPKIQNGVRTVQKEDGVAAGNFERMVLVEVDPLALKVFGDASIAPGESGGSDHYPLG